jgi:2-dehydropantoate 2-reductase
MKRPFVLTLHLLSFARVCTARDRLLSPAFAVVDHDKKMRHNNVLRAISAQQTSPTKQQEEMLLTKPLSVAIIGSGAVGSYYGARLWEAGHSVKYLFRGENFHAATRNGLNVTSVEGNMFVPEKEIQAFQETNEIGKVDWVLVSLKSSSLDAIPDLIYPLLDPLRTRVLVIMNGLIEHDLIRMLKKRFGESIDNAKAPLECCQTLYGGMALVCSNRLGPAVVHHSYGGLLTAGVASSRSLDPVQDEAAFRDLWKGNKVEIAYEPSLLRGRWRKMIWNLPFNGISVAMGGVTIDRVVSDAGLRELAYKVMDETIEAANADLERTYGKGGFIPLGQEDKDCMMTLSDEMGPYKTSTMLDLINRRSMEVQYMFRKPVERAREFGTPVPHLETLVVQIEALQRHYGLF